MDIATSPTQRATDPVAPDAPRLEPGTKAGEYVVERFLGAGAMGEVYAGKHPEIGKRVAIKVLKPSLATSKEATERFKREARVVNTIAHPNVIDIFAFGELDDGRKYLVMDLVEGQTLRAAVQDGPLDIQTTLDILDQIADALDTAHAKGIVHRDLKPDNVMIEGTKIRVLDFGIAKLVDTGDVQRSMLTGQGAWIGTPGYMAPEQWSADGASPASDRYALGVMAFELLSGKLPFQAGTLPQMMEQHFRTPVPALSTRGAVAARSVFDPVLSRAMAKDPDKRYATAKELVAALRDAAGKRRPMLGKRTWMPAAIGAGVLGVAVIVVVASRGPGERRAEATRTGDGTVVEVRSNPAGAKVMRGDVVLGTTPAKLDVGDADLQIVKPGYAPVTRHVKAGEDGVDIVLVQINGFEGTWVLPDGQLRAFTRSGDEHVDVFKLTSLSGEKEFYRKFHLDDALQGVKFSSTETVIDQRAPSEPSCQVPVKVEYEYDPKIDALTVQPEDVVTGFQNGKCVVHERTLVAAISLERADRHAETRTERAPMAGIVKPLDAPSLRSDSVNDTLTNPIDVPQKGPTVSDKTKDAAIQKKLDMMKAEEAKKNQGKKKIPPKKLPVSSSLDDLGGSKNNAPPPQQQKTSPAQNVANPPPQPQQANDEQVQGDSQVAPNIKKK